MSALNAALEIRHTSSFKECSLALEINNRAVINIVRMISVIKILNNNDLLMRRWSISCPDVSDPWHSGQTGDLSSTVTPHLSQNVFLPALPLSSAIKTALSVTSTR
jgi:hypothetical protein